MKQVKHGICHKYLIPFLLVYFAGWQFYLLLRPWNLCLNVLKSSTKILCANTVIPAPLFKLLSNVSMLKRCSCIFINYLILSLKFYQASGRAMVFYNFCLLWSAQNSAHSQHRAWIIINTILYFQYTKFECCRVNQSCIVKFPLLDSLESFIKYPL